MTMLLYHLVFPAKYRRAVIDSEVDKELQKVCLEIEKCYEIKFLEIGTDQDYVHFLIQSVPSYSITKIVTMIKSISAREIFKRCLDVRSSCGEGSFGVMVTLLVALVNIEMVENMRRSTKITCFRYSKYPAACGGVLY